MTYDNTVTKEEEVQMPSEIVRVLRHSCYRCGHRWMPRSKQHPVSCPKCKSPYWDKPKLVTGKIYDYNENANQ